MKTTLDEKGVLSIAPETPLEAFALKQRSGIAFMDPPSIASDGSGTVHHIRGSRFIVSTELEEVSGG